jgi:hypothetical protein
VVTIIIMCTVVVVSEVSIDFLCSPLNQLISSAQWGNLEIRDVQRSGGTRDPSILTQFGSFIVRFLFLRVLLCADV